MPYIITRDRNLLANLALLSETQAMLTGQLLARHNRGLPPDAPFEHVEFSVYSQYGDDGIIDHLLNHIALPEAEQFFVEFGVENYEEANTRFLMHQRNWSGLIMDGSAQHMAHARAQNYYWQHELTAAEAFVTCENVQALFKQHGVPQRLGLLHIDIDGNDYWVWEAITDYQPALVIMEYNALWGAEHAVSTPYKADFQRTAAHHSNLYFGASLAALCHLAEQKGYVCLGCNRHGNNVYFLQAALAGPFTAKAPQEAYRRGKFREHRNAKGELTHTPAHSHLAELAHLPLVDVHTGVSTTVGEVYGG